MVQYGIRPSITQELATAIWGTRKNSVVHDVARHICQALVSGELIEYYDISGCYILRPWAGAYTRPLLSSTSAVLVTPPRVLQSNRLVETHAANASHKTRLR